MSAPEGSREMLYTIAELDEALTALTSTLAKIEKIYEKDNLGRSQKTLIERRLKALRIASELISQRMSEMKGP